MWWLLFSVACGPEEAPDDIDGMTAFGFEHLPDDHSGSLESLGEKLAPWLRDHLDEALEGFSVLPLTATELSAWGVTVEQSTEVIGAMVGLSYDSELDGVVEGFLWPDQASIFTGVISQERTELTDRACFESGACEQHRTLDTVNLDLGVLGIESTYDQEMLFRHVDSDAGRAVGWGFVTPGEVTFNVDYLSVAQQYGFGWLFPGVGGGTNAVQCVWIEGEVEGLTVGEDYQLQLAIDGMVRSAEELDAWIQDRD